MALLASAASGAEYSLVDPANALKVTTKKDVNPGKVRLKKPPSKPKLKDGESKPPRRIPARCSRTRFVSNLGSYSVSTAGKPSTRSPSPTSPLINELDSELRSTFPNGKPMEEVPEMIQCKHCKKPMLKSVAASHIKLCLQKKQERLQKRKENKEAARKAREARDKEAAAAAAAALAAKDDDDNSGNEDGKVAGGQADGDDGKPKGAKKAAVKATGADGKATGKKRKADDGAEGEKEPKKKKTKKELEAAKAKVPKPKQPVDVEKQCGVPLPNGLLCARSLTCKTHSMGAKRQVPGRSAPYTTLLAQYQKRNQAKQQSEFCRLFLSLAIRESSTYFSLSSHLCLH